MKYHVTEATSRVYGFSFPARDFDEKWQALSYAKGVAYKIAEWAPGTGGSLFPVVRDDRGYETPYSILLY